MALHVCATQFRALSTHFSRDSLAQWSMRLNFENKVSNDFTCMATGKAYLSKQVEAVQLWCKFLSA